ncbi:MAG: F0F1 ATP synthase subunit A [Bacteroidota bacterium]|nr:F0F1 ATP synthase subunit A [Bacteroidota bacterium]MDX5430706.1 F0F1 ATP synthase subunit A [Bacteroidota bacterium]MDX5469453.1 F0F1 ATP synthase subunit A [Bacteroidota bacterium]
MKNFAFLLAFMTFTWSFGNTNDHVEAHDTTHDAVVDHVEGDHSAEGHDDHGSEEGFTAATMSSTILHHISDAHEWHFFTIGESHISLPLPVILYSEQYGLDIFMSSSFDHHTHIYKNYKNEHEHIVLLNEDGSEMMVDGHAVHPLDFSITKNVASMLLAVMIMALIFISMANAYKKRPGQAPKGLQSFMEPLVLFVRDEIARPNLGHNYARFMPYLLTMFFFIWINNLLGLLPGAANVTGNIAVTMLLALIALIVTNVNGNKSYWGHIFWPPGIPLPVKFILIPVEVISIFTKPFALMIRLFANITAGHIIIMSILSLIFLFSENGTNAGAGFGVSFASVPFAIFLYTLELLVAAIQAFIFTMLTALFIGQAMPEDHH